MIVTGVTKLSLEYSSLTLAMEPTLVQVRVLTVPTPHFSPPLGAVRARVPTILKLVSEVSTTVVSAVLVTRTFTVEEMLSGIVQAKVPRAASVEAVMTEAVAKLSVEYSSLTVANVPLLVQVTLRMEPTVQVSPPLGAVRVSEPLTVKLASEVSLTVASLTSEIRTRRLVPIASGIVQA